MTTRRTTTARATHSPSTAPGAYRVTGTGQLRPVTGLDGPGGQLAAAVASWGVARRTFWLTTFDEPPGVIVTP